MIKWMLKEKPWAPKTETKETIVDEDGSESVTVSFEPILISDDSAWTIGYVSDYGEKGTEPYLLLGRGSAVECDGIESAIQEVEIILNKEEAK